MSAGLANLIIEQGSTFDQTVTWQNADGTPKNLTGYTARMQVRAGPSSTAVVDLTTENGGITITALTGLIALTITATATAALSTGTAVYDLELITGSTVTRLLEGCMTVAAEVTHA